VVGKICERDMFRVGSETMRELRTASGESTEGEHVICDRSRKKRVRDRETGMRLTERSRELIRETV